MVAFRLFLYTCMSFGVVDYLEEVVAGDNVDANEAVADAAINRK